MSLREDVARRLEGGFVANTGFDPGPGFWLRMADEAIRIAEWQRHEADRVMEGHWGGPSRPECGDPNACCGEQMRENLKAEPLTLPPPDWKP